MIRQKRLAVAAVALAALAATGTATAASGAATPTPGPSKAAAVGKAVGKPAAPDTDLIAAAAALGVTPDALTAAIVGAKESFANVSGQVAPADFVAAVAERLGLPVAPVADALAPMIAAPPRGAGDKPDGKDRDGGDPADSPFATEAAAEAFAASTGVTVDRARAALATLVRMSAAGGGLEPTSQPFRDVAAGLGITADQLVSALGQLKASFNGG